MGRWISIEGIDGSGKSTLLAGLSRRLDAVGIDSVTAREPGGTLLGEKIRRLLLDPGPERVDPWAELLLYTTSRVQQLRSVVQPALASGRWVLSDRYVDATLAYQGYGRGLPVDRIRTVHDWATDAAWPELTVLLDCSPETALGRCTKRREGAPDRLEAESHAFFKRVRNGYLRLAEQEPDRIRLVDGDRLPAEVLTNCWSILACRFIPEGR